MIRMYEYEPRVDEEGKATEEYRDFENWLFSRPYDFIWDHPADKVVIYKVAYRISSMRRIPDFNQVTCLCVCDGNGNGGNGGGGLAKIKTDVSLHGEGNEAAPLGVQLSQKSGNRLQILEDGCYVGGDPLPYSPPSVKLTSSVSTGTYLTGEILSDMTLTVTITAGSEPLTDVRILHGKDNLHVFPVEAGVYVYTFKLTAGVDKNTDFTASISDGTDYKSNTLRYTFVLPVFFGIADTMTVAPDKIVAEKPVKVTGSKFEHAYGKTVGQYIWMACDESRVIKSITDENGFPVTAAFKKTDAAITVGEKERKYSLYVFDTKVTADNYKITFIC